MKKLNFIHLHIHSDYSMIDGLSKVNLLIKAAKDFNMPALALTDFNNLFGCIKFCNYAYQSGIKPIIGIDFLVKNEQMYNKLTCLATDQQGYKNLILLSSKAYQNKHNDIPVIQYSWLMEYNLGLIVLSGGFSGDIGQCLLENKQEKLIQYLRFYNKYFSNRYYLELVRTGRRYEELYLELAIELSIKNNLPVVATNDVRFIKKKDFHAHEIRVAIHDGVILNDIVNKSNKYSSEQFLKSEQEMCELFSDIPEALINSVEIAYRCNLIINLNKSFSPQLPKFPTGNLSTKDFLIKHATKGLEERLLYIFPNIEERCVKRITYDERLTNELEVISHMGLSDYFLIVMEFIQWAKDNNIPVGPGRGSGASSLVAYALRITELNPIMFNLLFERFLNPERISMPDLDIDFCMERRDLVIEHVVQTYGIDAVSQIITFGTMAAKAAIRDVGRVLGHTYSFVNRIAKLIPLELNITLDKAVSSDTQLKSLYEHDEEIKVLIDTARQLEGIIRNVSKHAGGIVIAPVRIIDFSPLYYDHDNTHSITQFDKDDIECIGLIKFDFLGLRTLTIIDHALKMINIQRIKKKLNIFDINYISLHDQKVFNTLQTAETTAIFQLESRGIRQLIRRLKPDCFEDLIALVALFRPGPLQSGMVDNFINRKHGHEDIAYPDSQWQHISLRSALESTYGIILYQEQVMQIAQILSGYTLGRADLLRRAIGKKKIDDMEKQRSFFNIGAIRKGVDSTLAMKIFDLVEKFAGYGFNKSHSSAYALISYQTLWLKTYYPAEFMASALSADMDNLNKILQLVYECRRMHLKILPPDINLSQYHFFVNKNQEIVYGIGAIKGIGKTSIESIIRFRKKNGNFKNLFDLCMCLGDTKVNYRMIEKLIISGACDAFDKSRAELLASLKKIIKYSNRYMQTKYSKQQDLFINMYKEEVILNNRLCIPKWTPELLLDKEKEALGFYLTDHPIFQYRYLIKYYVSSIIKIKNILYQKNHQIVYIFGLLISIRTRLNKQGKHVVFGVLEDYSGQLEIVILPSLIKKYQNYLIENTILLVKGMLSFDKLNGYCKVIVHTLKNIDYLLQQYTCGISIILNHTNINNQLLEDLFVILKNNNSGKIPIYFIYQKESIQTKLICGEKWYVTPTMQLLINLHNLIGYNQIKLQLC